MYCYSYSSTSLKSQQGKQKGRNSFLEARMKIFTIQTEDFEGYHQFPLLDIEAEKLLCLFELRYQQHILGKKYEGRRTTPNDFMVYLSSIYRSEEVRTGIIFCKASLRP